MTNSQQLVLEAASATGTSGARAAEEPESVVQLTELKPVAHSRIDHDDHHRSLRDADGPMPARGSAAELEFFGLRPTSSPSTQLLPQKRPGRWKRHPRTDASDEATQDDEDEDDDDDDDDDDDSYINGDFEYLQENREVYEFRDSSALDKNSQPKKRRLLCSEQSDDIDEFDEDDDDDVLDKDYREEECDDDDDDDDDDYDYKGKGSLTKRRKKSASKQQEATVSTSSQPRRRGRPKKTDKVVKSRKKSQREPKKTSKLSEQSEKELQNKINEIIKKNYLLEHENNNNEEADNKKSRDNGRSKPSGNNNNDEADDDDDDDEDDADDDADSGEKRYHCLQCEACFKGSGGLRNHCKVVHATGPHYKCDECGKEFPLKERLKLHVRTHTGFKPYKCPECDKSFARGGQLVQHRRTHSQDKPYRCELCSGTFTCAANLALHLKRHTGQKDHKCEICGRGFIRRDALKKHFDCLHKDVKSFLCKICNKTFKGHLPQHMRTHARDRPHGCATCGQRFAQKSQLTVHQRTHSGQRPFRCLVCWQAFAHSTALKLHTRRHTGERPFKCDECSAGFTQLPHWKKHMKCIHGRSEPYCCRKCNCFFRIKNDLEAHQQDCHAEDSDQEDEGTTSDTAAVSATTPYTFPPLSSASLSSPSSSSSSSSSSSTISSASSCCSSGLPSSLAVTADAEEPPHRQPLLPELARYRSMPIEKMRLLLAVLLKRISKQERLDELGFGKRLIDEVLVDSLVSAGKEAVKVTEAVSEFQALRTNLAVFLEWTVPKEHWTSFRSMDKTPEEILETLTIT